MNHKLSHLFFLFLFIFALISCSSDDTTDPINNPDDPEPLEMEFRENVSYGTQPQQIYDIYLPANRSSESTKTLIMIHGGFWSQGDKSDLLEYMDLVRELLPEYAVVNMNYVLADNSTPAFPNQFMDIDLLIDKLTAQKEDLQILPEFGLIGVSSGAHLSLQYDYVYDVDDQVKMVCDVVGPTDFTDPHYTDQLVFIDFLVDETAYPENTDFTVELSPVFHVSAASSPTIMFYGEDDDLIPTANATVLQNALNNMGIPNSLTFYPGGHGDWSDDSFDDFEVKLKDFIETNFSLLP